MEELEMVPKNVIYYYEALVKDLKTMKESKITQKSKVLLSQADMTKLLQDKGYDVLSLDRPYIKKDIEVNEEIHRIFCNNPVKMVPEFEGTGDKRVLRKITVFRTIIKEAIF